MRTYRKREPDWTNCAHCYAPFERTHQGRLYCCNSCCTQAYNARKAAMAAKAAKKAAKVAPRRTLAPPPPEVTLALNWQNAAVLAGSALLADGLQHLGHQVLSPTLPTGPTSWLPAALRQRRGALVPLQPPGWASPRLFHPLPYQGQTYYYRAPEDLLLWQDAAGTWIQLTHEADFLAVVHQPSASADHYLPPPSANDHQPLPPTDLSALSCPAEGA